MPSLAYLKLSDRLACQAGPAVIYGVLHPEELLEASDLMAIEEQESLSFAYARVDRQGEPRSITAQMRAGRVITEMWEDDSFDEWRLGGLVQGRALRGRVSVQGVPLSLDLAERPGAASGKGWVSELSNGERIFDYEIAERTASSILSSYVIPNLASWITLGTVDPTLVIPAISVNRLTPWQLALAVRDALREMDVPCELRLRRNGTTDYKLDLVTQIGASAATPIFHPHCSLRSLVVRTDPTLQATRLLVRGGTAPDSFPGILGRARWKGGAPSGTVIALSDRNGGSSPIAFADQWVGAYLLRVKTGRTFPITAADAVAGSVTLGGGVSTIAADVDFEFRLTEPLTNTARRIGADTNPKTHAFVLTVVASTVFTLVERWVTTDAVGVDDQHMDWYLRRASAVATPTFSNMTSGGVLTVSSVAGIQVGDIVILGQTATPHGYSSGVLVVDAVNAGPVTLDCHVRDSGAPLGTGSYGAGWTARVYRPVATLHRVTDSVAAADTITVDAAGTAAVNDLVEIVQLDGAGEVPAYVDHPLHSQADPTGYGVKTGELVRANTFGLVNLVPNSWMRAWANAANPPDGWTKTGTGTSSQETVTTRFGGRGWAFAITSFNTFFDSPVFFPNWDSGHTKIAARMWVYFSVYSGEFPSQFGLHAIRANGTVDPNPVNNNARVSIMPTDATTVAATKIGTGAWIELKVEGVVLNGVSALYGVVGRFAPIVSGGPFTGATGVIDTMEVYPFATCPSASYEFGDATILLQAANRKLAEIATPPVSYEMGAHDLERAFPEEYPRLATTLGGDIRAADLEYGTDVTVRLLRRDRDLLHAAKTDFVLANRPTRLTDLVQAGVRAPVTDPTVTLVSSGGGTPVLTPPAAPTTFTIFTAAATVPAGSEVTTPSTAPVLTVDQGATVTYVPSVTTSPTTTVAPAVAGAAPRPRPRALK